MPSNESTHQTLSQIRSLLAAHDLRPRHRFGQNFLHDDSKLTHIINAANLSPGDAVLEVGPGTGALSIRLIQQGAALLAIEIDQALEPILQEQFTNAAAATTGTNDPTESAAASPPPRIIIADVLAGKHEINPLVLHALKLVTTSANKPNTFKLIANLPYNVASPLLINLMLLPFSTDQCDPPPPTMTGAVVTIQREVADRLAAPPGGKDYGPLSVMIQSMYAVKLVTNLPAGCFWPPPKVESAAVAITALPKALTERPDLLSTLLHRLFSKRRKQIGSILGRNFPLPAGIQATYRPEQLTVEQLIELSHVADDTA